MENVRYTQRKVLNHQRTTTIELGVAAVSILQKACNVSHNVPEETNLPAEMPSTSPIFTYNGVDYVILLFLNGISMQWLGAIRPTHDSSSLHRSESVIWRVRKPQVCQFF